MRGAWGKLRPATKLRFLHESIRIETCFRDQRAPHSRSSRVFAFDPTTE
jgi:hypothetical protein